MIPSCCAYLDVPVLLREVELAELHRVLAQLRVRLEDAALALAASCLVGGYWVELSIPGGLSK